MRNQNAIYTRYFTYIKPIIRFPLIRTYGSTIFTIIVIFIFIFFAIKPTVQTILILQKKLTDAESVLQKVTQKANDLSKGKENYDNLNPFLKDKIESAIPGSIKLNSLIQTLEQLALKNEASVSALQIQPIVIESKKNTSLGVISQISFTFNIEAQYPNIISFLQELKTSNRLISVDNLSLTKSSEGSAAIIMSIGGKGYYIK